jgi:hypothetical protein
VALEYKLTAFSVCEKWVREVENGLFLSWKGSTTEGEAFEDATDEEEKQPESEHASGTNMADISSASGGETYKFWGFLNVTMRELKRIEYFPWILWWLAVNKRTSASYGWSGVILCWVMTCFFKGTVQLPEPAKQISPEQLKFEVNLCKSLNVQERMDPVQFLTLLFFITCIGQRFRDIIYKKDLIHLDLTHICDTYKELMSSIWFIVYEEFVSLEWWKLSL